jgi:NAD-dependent dihydropyrimidine dehydrogenase PreA subunit
MAKRSIIEINRDLCNGCGLCTTACAEGALELDKEGKAVLVREIFCDGLGACLDVCPTGALKVVKKDSAEYDAKASYEHVLRTRGESAAAHVHGAEELVKKEEPASLGCGCPGSMAREIKREPGVVTSSESAPTASELSQWPIQLHLVSPYAPYFNEVDLLIAADCTAFTIGSFHRDLLKGKKLVIACPKLDDTSEYVEKIAEILKNNTIYSLTVAIMTVPCCSGLARIVDEAVALSGKSIAVRKVVINLDGSIKK